jgi:hypothetical protein
MTVVINELEVVVAPTPGPGEEGTQGPQTAAAAPLTPVEIAELLERRTRQELRLFAH